MLGKIMSCLDCLVLTETKCKCHQIYYCKDHLNSHMSKHQSSLSSKFLKLFASGNNIRELAIERKKLRIEKQRLIEKKLSLPRNPNYFEKNEKKLFMDSFENIGFEKLFGLGKENRKYIREILFSNDKKYAFVCKIYLGNEE